MSRYGWTLALLVTLVASLAGCSPQGKSPTVAEVADAAASSTTALVGELDELTRAYDGNPAVQNLQAALRTAGNAFGLALPSLPSLGVTLARARVGTYAAGDTNTSGTALEQYLRDHIFTAANLESSDDTSLTFRIPGAAICSAGDAHCIQRVDEAQLRVVATLRAGGAVDLVLLVGPDRAQPLRVHLASGAFDLELDLAEAAQAATYLASVDGELLELPVVTGTVRLEVTRLGAQDYTVAGAVTEAIHVGPIQPDATSIVFDAATSDPTWWVHADGAHQAVEFALNVPRLQAAVPYARVAPTGTAGTLLQAELAGLTGDLTLDGAEPGVLTLDDLGLGPTTSRLQLDGRDLVTADLLGGTARTLSLRVAAADDGLFTYTFGSAVDLSAGLFLAPLLVDAYVSPAARDEIYAARFEGASPSLKPLPPAYGLSRAALQVVSGTLTLETTHTGIAPVVAQAGQCLYADPAPTGDHPLQRLLVGDCP